MVKTSRKKVITSQDMIIGRKCNIKLEAATYTCTCTCMYIASTKCGVRVLTQEWALAGRLQLAATTTHRAFDVNMMNWSRFSVILANLSGQFRLFREKLRIKGRNQSSC